MTLLLTSLLTTLALAQDADEDGCIDSYADANDACVDVAASVDPSASVGAEATVQAYASVGPDVALGASAFVGARATVTGRIDAVGPVPIGAGTVIGRRTIIGADQDLGAGNTFSRAVTTGARLQTDEEVAVGYASTIGDDVVIGGYSTIGSLTGIGDYTHVAPLTIIARNATIADSLSPANIAGTIGPNVTIGWGANLDSGTRIRKDADLGNNVTTLGDVRIGRDADIGDNVVLGDGVRIRAGGNVLDWARVPEGTVIGRNESFAPINTPPTAGTWAVAPLGPVEGEDDLVCTAQVAPADADVWQVLDVSIDWQRDGVDWVGATSTGTYTGDTIPGAQTVEADAWRCRAAVSDGVELVSSAWSAAVTVETDFIASPEGVRLSLSPSSSTGTVYWANPNDSSLTYRVDLYTTPVAPMPSSPVATYEVPAHARSVTLGALAYNATHHVVVTAMRGSRESAPARAGRSVFTRVGASQWVRPPGVTSVDVLIVGGGGGGGRAIGGGGGDGGVVLLEDYAVGASAYTVTVGDGGTGARSTALYGGWGGVSVWNADGGDASVTALGGEGGMSCGSLYARPLTSPMPSASRGGIDGCDSGDRRTPFLGQGSAGGASHYSGAAGGGGGAGTEGESVHADESHGIIWAVFGGDGGYGVTAYVASDRYAVGGGGGGGSGTSPFQHPGFGRGYGGDGGRTGSGGNGADAYGAGGGGGGASADGGDGGSGMVVVGY